MTASPRFPRLDDWLEWQQRCTRIRSNLASSASARVLARTGWRGPATGDHRGGTNGKGSCVALLDALLRAGGYRVGTFTSPHLVDYRERIRLDGAMVSAASLIAAFERIADALGRFADVLRIQHARGAARLRDVLPGRDRARGRPGRAPRRGQCRRCRRRNRGLDRPSITWSGWGPIEESIGREKAGIFRCARPAICGMAEPPHALADVAEEVGAPLLLRCRDFDTVEHTDGRWDFRDAHGELIRLPAPALEGVAQTGNAATALAALRQLADRLPLNRAAIESGLVSVQLPGRFQRVPGAGGIEWVLDVAHNPAAAATLATNLARHAVPGRTVAVCGMLDDKDVGGVLIALRDRVDRWFAATTEGPRGLADTALAARAHGVGIEMITAGSVTEAMRRAAREARVGDRIVVFGSFHTVGPALACV
jgi:dihydrofolate synthase / folylpolyglutamate synthase